MSLLVAQSGHRELLKSCRLLGVKRTSKPRTAVSLRYLPFPATYTEAPCEVAGGCAVGALASSPPAVDGTSGFGSPTRGAVAGVNCSWDCAPSFGFNRLNSKLLV